MRVAITGDDGFIAQYIQAAIGEDAEIIPREIIDDEMMLGATSLPVRHSYTSTGTLRTSTWSGTTTMFWN